MHNYTTYLFHTSTQWAFLFVFLPFLLSILAATEENFDDETYPCFTRLSLWSFIYNLLEEETKTCVKWTDRENLEFKVEDTDGLAHEWGKRKGSHSMTWPKFARAMRYYYGKGVLEKVNYIKNKLKLLTYKFHASTFKDLNALV